MDEKKPESLGSHITSPSNYKKPEIPEEKLPQDIEKLKSKIAFGPFLVIGTVVMLFWGEKITEMIKKIYEF